MKATLPYKVVFLIFTCTINFWACTQKEENLKDDHIFYAVHQRIDNLDPTRVQDPYTLQIVGLIFEGLVTLDGTQKLVPALAESWDVNDDYSIWTFHIRKNVYFHSNIDIFGNLGLREVTAEDVRYSFEKLVSKGSYPGFVVADAVSGVSEFQIGKSDSVKGFEVVDRFTFRVHLVQPEPAFINRLTSPWYSIFPKEAFELGPNIFGNKLAIGTGPFMLKHRKDTEVELVRNPHYWHRSAGEIEKISIRTIENDQIRFSELRKGNINVMRITKNLERAILNVENNKLSIKPQYSDTYNLGIFSTFDSFFLGFNTETVPSSLRRAISLGINRREIVKTITNNTAKLSTGTVPIGLLGYTPPYPSDLFNQLAARSLLTTSTKGRTLRIVSIDRDLGELIKIQLSEIGIAADVEYLSYNGVLDRMIKGTADAFIINFVYVFSAPEVILNNLFNSSKRPVPNFFRYNSKKVDSMLLDIRHLRNRDDANNLANKIEKIIIDDAPAAFLYQPQNLVVFDKKYYNLRANGHGVLNFGNITMKSSSTSSKQNHAQEE